MNERKYRQEDGVILTLRNMSDGSTACVDIEIPQEIRTLALGIESEKLNYCLRGVMKSFPNIEELRILGTAWDIEIYNFMFPNVKYVDSRNSRYKSGKALIQIENYSRYVLRNAFCSKEALDLRFLDEQSKRVYFTLDDYAIEGSLCEKNPMA